ncbi:hypothetical protein [Streptomyces sp. NPDC002644]
MAFKIIPGSKGSALVQNNVPAICRAIGHWYARKNVALRDYRDAITRADWGRAGAHMGNAERAAKMINGLFELMPHAPKK